MANVAIGKRKYSKLITAGYCVAEQVVEETMLERVRAASIRLIGVQPAEHFTAQKPTGSMISVYADPFFAEPLAYLPDHVTLASLAC